MSEPLSRREFMFLGVGAGATVAVGVVVPLSLASRQETSAAALTTTTTLTLEPTDPGVQIPPVFAVVGAFPRLRLGNLADFAVGEPITFDYPQKGQSNMAVKLGTPIENAVGPDSDLVAFSRICTHMGCVIEKYQADHSVLGPCPCHFSTFDFAHNGQVVLGQATQNLPQVTLQVVDDEVFATGVIRLVYGYSDTLLGGELVEVEA